MCIYTYILYIYIYIHIQWIVPVVTWGSLILLMESSKSARTRSGRMFVLRDGDTLMLLLPADNLDLMVWYPFLTSGHSRLLSCNRQKAWGDLGVILLCDWDFNYCYVCMQEATLKAHDHQRLQEEMWILFSMTAVGRRIVCKTAAIIALLSVLLMKWPQFFVC